MVSTLNASNCFDLIVLGDLNEAANLKKTALDFVSKNSATLVKTDAYKDFLKERPDLLFEVTQSMVLSKEIKVGILIKQGSSYRTEGVPMYHNTRIKEETN